MNVKHVLLVAGVVFVVIGVLSFFLLTENHSTQKNQMPRAVIIDQLYSDVPSKYFHDESSAYLKQMGYTVDIYTTTNATVDFFRNLPKMNYDFIVYRGHALSEKSERDTVMFFTGEKYSEEKYIPEQLLGQIKKGAPILERTFSIDEKNSTGWVSVNGSDNIKMISSPVRVFDDSREEFFLFSPKSVNDLMTGRFNESIILLGGCSTLHNDSMAKSLIQKGASKIVGWSDLVSASDNDQALLQILENMANKKLSVTEATNKVKETFVTHPKYNATLGVFG